MRVGGEKRRCIGRPLPGCDVVLGGTSWQIIVQAGDVGFNTAKNGIIFFGARRAAGNIPESSELV